MQRPQGITVLAILALIAGGVGLIVGALGLAFGGAAAAPQGQAMADAAGIPGLGANAMILGMFAMLLALLDLIFAYGAWKLMNWAWILGIVLQALTIAQMLSMWLMRGFRWPEVAVIGLAAIILVYMLQPKVRAAFQSA